MTANRPDKVQAVLDRFTGAKVPRLATLKKYGMTAWEWVLTLHGQGGVCAVCKKLPKNGRLCIDHDHVKGWKKLPAAERRKHVRGLLCYFCNRYCASRSVTVESAAALLEYLTLHQEENRRNGR